MKLKKKSILIGSLLTAFVVCKIILWAVVVAIFIKTSSHEELQEIYLSFFPEFMRNVFIGTLIDIFLCVISNILILWSDSKRVFLRVMLVILNIILILWLTFSLL